jgi:hypothetical protein
LPEIEELPVSPSGDQRARSLSPAEQELIVLVVAERAASGAELEEQARLYRASTDGFPGRAFVEIEDDPTNETFGNGRVYADAMNVISIPTVEEALAWESETINALARLSVVQ